MKNLREKIENAVIRQKLSSRGGGIEIDLTIWGYVDEKMTAYQNYLGGGMLGAICNDCTIRDWETEDKLIEVAEELRKYMHELTNPVNEWETSSYEDNQKRSVSAY